MKGWRDETASNAVEFAIVLPILIMLLFGIISGGMLYNQQLSLTQAAREGARFGATLDLDYDGDCGDWEECVLERTVNASSGTLSGHPVDISTDDQDESTVVTVYVERPATLDVIMLPAWNITLSATSIARHEGG